MSRRIAVTASQKSGSPSLIISDGFDVEQGPAVVDHPVRFEDFEVSPFPEPGENTSGDGLGVAAFITPDHGDPDPLAEQFTDVFYPC